MRFVAAARHVLRRRDGCPRQAFRSAWRRLDRELRLVLWRNSIYRVLAKWRWRVRDRPRSLACRPLLHRNLGSVAFGRLTHGACRPSCRAGITNPGCIWADGCVAASRSSPHNWSRGWTDWKPALQGRGRAEWARATEPCMQQEDDPTHLVTILCKLRLSVLACFPAPLRGHKPNLRCLLLLLDPDRSAFPYFASRAHPSVQCCPRSQEKNTGRR